MFEGDPFELVVLHKIGSEWQKMVSPIFKLIEVKGCENLII